MSGLCELVWLERCSLGKIMRCIKQRDVSGWRGGGRRGVCVRESQNERRNSEMQPGGHLVSLYVEEINRRAYIVSSAGL